MFRPALIIPERRIVPVQDLVAANSNSSTKAATLSSTPIQGNTLILCSCISNTYTISSISQTNVTWTKLLNTTSLNPTQEMWAGAVGGSPGTTITVTYSNSAFNCWWAGEFEGLSGTVDQSSVSSGVVTHYHTGFITPSAEKLVIAQMGTSNGSQPFTVPAFGGGVMATVPATKANIDNTTSAGTIQVVAYETNLKTSAVFGGVGGNHSSIIASIN